MHSEDETYRATLRARTLDGQLHTLIVTRRATTNPGRIWLTLHGAWKTTVAFTDCEAACLADLLTQAQQPIIPPSANASDASRRVVRGGDQRPLA